MNFINNLTALLTPANIAVQSKPAFKGVGNISLQTETENKVDSFSTNPIYSILGNEAEVYKLAQSSEVIRKRCKELNIPIKVNMDVLEDME